jgi:hypothetical protein
MIFKKKSFILFSLLLVSCFVYSQKNTLRPYYDTLVYARTAIKPSFQKAPSSEKSSNRVLKTIELRNNFPFQKEIIRDSLHQPIIDTFYIKAFVGDIYLKKWINWTFLNPANDLLQNKKWIVPSSLAYYQNPTNVTVDVNQFQLNLNELTNKNLSDFFKPFFILNNEIRNSDYKVFVNYVRDSVARRLLAAELGAEKWLTPTFDTQGNLKDTSEWNLNWETPLDWRKIEENEQYQILADLYLGRGDRFYDRLAIDSKKLNYQYIDKEGNPKTLNIYPDTLKWNSVCSFYFGDWTNMYFWHVAFDDYPVVNISWDQAQAFCNWITKEVTKFAIKEKLPFKLNIDLPTIYQWEYAVSKSMDAQKVAMKSNFSWLTDLIINDNQFSPINDSITEKYASEDDEQKLGSINRLTVLLRKTYPCQFLDENGTYKYLRDYFLKRIVYNPKNNKNDVLNINNLGKNVSEWLQESYNENYQLMYYKRMELLLKTKGMDADIQALLEEYYNTFNHPYGRMVVGANWLDYRDEYYEGKSYASQMAKIFADPTKGYPTVGFRLVMNIEPIE